MRAFAFLFTLAGCTQIVAFDAPRESGEQCTDGVDNDGNGRTDCEEATCAGTAGCLGCGDGVVDFGEECDDRNTLPNDGCSPACRIEICGDGAVNPGEACDDGNADDTDGCLATCVAASCGDGLVQVGAEECDDQNAALDDGCTPACALERCGDGVRQSGPAIQSVEFQWLATSCAPSTDIRFRINGVIGLQTAGDPEGSCTCAPPSGFRSVFGEAPELIDGLNVFEVEFAGPDQFLAWAMVVLHTTAGDREIVVYEGAPGAAAARVTQLCNGGFDDNVPPIVRPAPVSVFEECDDGNQDDTDACRNNCRIGRQP